MKRLLLSASAIVLLLSSSCTPVRLVERELPEGFPFHSAEQIQQFLHGTTAGVDAYETRASLRIDSPTRSGSFTSVIRQRAGDTLWANLSPGFGIEAARALVTRDTFLLHDRISRVLYHGAFERAQRLLPISGDLSEMAATLVGLLQPHQHMRWSVLADDSLYYLRSSDRTITLTVDPAIWRVVHYEERTLSGELTEERTFSDFARIGTTDVALLVTVERPQEETFISVYHRDLRLNPAELDFTFIVPDGVRRVPLD